MMENSELTFVATDSFGIDLSDYQVFLFAGGVICWTWVNSDHLPLAATEAIDNIIKGE
ncbi:hypothetical protein P4H94_28435 [Paenibacillus macerans]|uniref:hypothetical protein n=1 Tax=Paenibacillus macerans TaxID=44252 RepID=UPI002DBEE075|nr:hypothetical protein [Paenibacillus macerans]MEC0140775.1 hypothetical protein [Paenibacillus macerans]